MPLEGLTSDSLNMGDMGIIVPDNTGDKARASFFCRPAKEDSPTWLGLSIGLLGVLIESRATLELLSTFTGVGSALELEATVAGGSLATVVARLI
ncbi:hypothetical protein QJS10_CPA05g01455 [Acorus calamus]|uniref:Uncharacterized protein n=1 Tax=Acorus calamus TaxID=4465 RepID=A0AAV9ETB1_ACOCL|nr:hypothetical protein QJS10_CPA05g01455 [Acorus calamus]